MHSTAVPTRLTTHPAVTAFLARYRGDSRKTYTAAMTRYLTWCEEHGVDPLAATRAADPRMAERYDRNRHNLDRHAVYKLGAHLSGIADRIAA